MQIAKTLQLPDAIGLGFRRCASSWVHSVLSGHGEIQKPKDGLHFFSAEYERGIEWYSDHFSAAPSSKIAVEFSVSYSYPAYCDQVARRIKQHAPKAKLFAIIRDPIERAFSDYLRSTRSLEIPSSLTFEQALERFPVYLDRSMYGRILSPFFELFPADQIYIASYRDLAEDTNSFLQSFFAFLNVSPGFDIPEVEQRMPQGQKVKSPFLNRTVFAVKSTADSIFNRVSSRRWQAFKEKHTASYAKLIAANTASATISDETRQQLRNHFKQDTSLLSNLMKRGVAQCK